MLVQDGLAQLEQSRQEIAQLRTELGRFDHIGLFYALKKRDWLMTSARSVALLNQSREQKEEQCRTTNLEPRTGRVGGRGKTRIGLGDLLILGTGRIPPPLQRRMRSWRPCCTILVTR